MFGHHDYRAAALGVNMVQMSIVVALVAVACIAALTVLGDSAGLSFDTITQGLPGEAPKVPATQGNAQGNGSGSGAGSQNPLIQVGGAGGGLQYNDFTSNVARAIETTGANGTVNGLLENLKAQTEYFKSTGQISEAQYTDLMALVSQGYRMADAQKAVEAVIANSGDDASKLKSATVMFEGKSYTVDELRTQFGVAPDYRIAGSLFETFLASKNTVTGTMSDPKAKQVVTVLADQILSVSNSFEGSIGMSTLGYDSGTESIFQHTAAVDNLNELKALGIVSTSWDEPLPDPPSTYTKNNSNEICKQSNRASCKL